jgi:hypothetical protein
MPEPVPQHELDEYAEVRIPFDDVLRKLTNTSTPPKAKASSKKAPAPKKA